MPKFHFYDIESLNNIFTLTNYLPEENTIEQYYLADDKLEKKLQAEPDLLNKLTDRVQSANKNFTIDNKTIDSDGNLFTKGTGSVRLYNLRTVEANVHLAETFGMSTANNISDPTDATNLYPNSFRLVCDTDKSNQDSEWSTQSVQKRYDQKLSTDNQLNNIVNKSDLKRISQFTYHEYNDEQDPYLLGYNSNNYDLTMLAIYLQNAFQLQDQYIKDVADRKASLNPDNIDLYSQNETGYHYFKINPMSPELLRKFNNYLFTKDYKDNMSSILYKAPKNPQNHNIPYDLHLANKIRRNMIKSGRHLDVSNLNEKMRKVGLKRLLGMLGYQILESDKLSTGTDHIDNLDQFYDLLAYNASDCINLKVLFDHPDYQGQFQLKKSMLETYPMIVYQKQADKYDADIRPDRVKPNRVYIDSSSAQIATNVVYPYGKLLDSPVVNFNYPDKRQAKKLGIKQFNVLKQTKQFFNDRVYKPALKTNPTAAKKAKAQFDVIMNYYANIQGKNFNDSEYYYQYVFAKYNHNYQDKIKNLKSDDFDQILSNYNALELIMLNQGFINQIQTTYRDLKLTLGAPFIKASKLTTNNTPVKLADFLKCLPYQPVKQYLSKLNLIQDFNNLYEQFEKYNKNTNKIGKNLADNFQSNKNTDKSAFENLDYNTFKKALDKLFIKIFNTKITLEAFSDKLLNNWADAKLFINDKQLYGYTIAPYTVDQVTTNNNLPFFDKNANPTSGYAYFSVGGVHGAEYDKEQYDKDLSVYNKSKLEDGQLSLAGFGTAVESKNKTLKPVLFKQSSNGSFELADRYVYTSIDPTNHEDFKSYYPNLCRMLMIYWNDGIGKDIYGEIYDRKEELGKLMKDPTLSKEKREYYGVMRAGTKLILNSTTGKGDSHGQNSPIQVNNNIMAMRLIGQMFTWRIGQAQTLAGAKVVSTNTDGLYTVMPDKELNDKILRQESKEIHVEIDPERLILISKDSNNRMELTEDYKISSVAGSTLAAYHGPNPSKALAHPAAIDKALGDYLLLLSKPDSKYYDPKLQNSFNKTLGLTLLHSLVGKNLTEINKLTDPVERHNLKRKMLNYFQNIVSSSSGSNRYIFTSKNYITDPNDKLINPADKQYHNQDTYEELSLFPNEDLNTKTLNLENYNVIQHYNRLFYVKENSSLDTVHIYVASGRKVPDKDLLKRKKNNLVLYNNSDLASYILKQNGLDINELNQTQCEAKVVKLPSLPPQWACYLVNQSLDTLTETEMDNILNNLDYDHYLELLEKIYMNSWTNRKDLQKNFQKEFNKKYAD